MGPAGVRRRARVGAVLLLAAACLAACNRESRDTVTAAAVETGPRGVTLSDPDEWSAVCPDQPETEPLLLMAGSWHEQGLPEYAGLVEYSQRLIIPEAWQHCRVFLELSRLRDAVEVVINGTVCGVQVTAPYSFEVTPALVPGAAAEIKLRIWNTAQAVMADKTEALLPSGLLGPARLVAYPVVEIAIEANA